MRIIWCALLGMIAALFALMGTAESIMLRSRPADDRAYYEEFRATAARVGKYEQLPSLEVQLKMEKTGVGKPYIFSSLTKPADCNPSFKPAADDRFVLWFSRGWWRECYAHPSGRSTLPMSFQDYLRGFGPTIVVYWLIAAAFAWWAIRLRPKREA